MVLADEHVPAVAADVVKSADFSVLSPHNEDVVTQTGEGPCLEVAGVGQVIVMPDRQPGLLEYLVDVSLITFFRKQPGNIEMKLDPGQIAVDTFSH
jgi:hypothetical protein